MEKVLRNPLEALNGVWLFSRNPFGRSRCYSLPGHLLHLIIKGSYTLRIGGREYKVSSGDMIYYYESECVEYHGNESEVEFYSAGFSSEAFEALPVEERVFRAGKKTKSLFRELYRAYNAKEEPGMLCLSHSLLLRIIAEVEKGRTRASSFSVKKGGGLWRGIESEIRRRRLFRPTLDQLAEISGMSRASIVRSCRLETGESPMKRVREIRMNEALGLLRFAHMNVSQVAEQLGYPRIHEFCRDFSRHFGSSPGKERLHKCL